MLRGEAVFRRHASAFGGRGTADRGGAASAVLVFAEVALARRYEALLPKAGFPLQSARWTYLHPDPGIKLNIVFEEKTFLVGILIDLSCQFHVSFIQQ